MARQLHHQIWVAILAVVIHLRHPRMPDGRGVPGLGPEPCQRLGMAGVLGPAPKQLAVTGGTGSFGNAGGDGTLVEFGNGKGKLTLHLLSLVARGGGG